MLGDFNVPRENAVIGLRYLPEGEDSIALSGAKKNDFAITLAPTQGKQLPAAWAEQPAAWAEQTAARRSAAAAQAAAWGSAVAAE